jgi:NAD(P)-dependent dehydrogenase (short-subunit alcohol dehydrogenase family)
MATNSLEGKSIIVTGAGRGIGREIALLCAAEGAKVVVNEPGGAADGSGSSATPAEEVVEEIKKRGGIAVANFETVAEAIPASKIVKMAVDTYGKLDGVVNNAGILRDAIFHRMSIDAFESVIKVHLMGSFYVSHAAARLFREQESGAFVHFTSISARPITPRPSSASSAYRNRSRSTWSAFMSAPTASRRSPGAG